MDTLIGKPAPTFSAPDSNGETYDFAAGSYDAPTVLFFFPKAGKWPCDHYVSYVTHVLIVVLMQGRGDVPKRFANYRR